MRIFYVALFALAAALPARAQDIPFTILSPEDVKTYRAVFAAQDRNDIKKADALIAGLQDKVLIPYVLQHRYLSTRYKTSFGELRSWLGAYGDVQGADRVKRLAERRKPNDAPALPAIPSIRWRGGGADDETFTEAPIRGAAAQSVYGQLQSHIRDSKPELAEARVSQLAPTDALPQNEIDQLAAYVAAAYLAEGRDTDALRLAETIVERGKDNAPLSHWTAGLASYRMGRFENAAKHFEAITRATSMAARHFSGASFWAARSWMRADNPSRVVTLYARAASETRTFYGILAARVLGRDPGIAFAEPVLDRNSLHIITQNKSARRAIALWQIGRKDAIDLELARAFGELPPEIDPAFAALARNLGSASMELRAAETSTKRDIYLTSLYPLLPYQPTGGYTLDQALVLAVAKQESRFMAAAESSSGARGLMQIMPATAVVITKDPTLARANIDRLDDPVYSLTLGQDYLNMLLARQDGDLLKLAAAYNGGMGNLSRWLNRQQGNDDALVFIESIPSPQTRDYVKRVMLNMWMYKKRLGEDMDALDAIAAGQWPIYKRKQTVANLRR